MNVVTYLCLCHVAEDAENNKAGHKAGGTIDGAENDEKSEEDVADVIAVVPGDEGVFVTVIVELVVAGQGKESAKTWPQ